MAKNISRYGSHRTAFNHNKKRIFAEQTHCGICGKPVDFSLKYPNKWCATIDHIIPIDKGGHKSDIENLQLAHMWCNRQKSNKTIIEVKDKMAENQRKNPKDIPHDGTKKDLPLSADWKNFFDG